MLASITDIFSTVDFWRGVGRFLIDAFLVYALLMIVLAVLGHPPRFWPFARGRSADQPPGGKKPLEHPNPVVGEPHVRQSSSERHREYLDQLGTALKYQGSTVVLIVFAVILLGFQRVLAGTEVATILSGIAGFVLGQTKAATPEAPANSNTGGSGTSGSSDGEPPAGSGGATAS